MELGLKAGNASGTNAANKAAMIHGASVEDDEARKLALFQEIARRCEALQASDPDNANAYTTTAMRWGATARASRWPRRWPRPGGGGTRQPAKAIALEPRHADAHIALGTWHAEIINKVGAMVGGLTLRRQEGRGGSTSRPRCS